MDALIVFAWCADYIPIVLECREQEKDRNQAD